MREAERLSELAARLVPWYEAAARELPWRREASAYRVWISEIMLQQTRIETVMGYFDRFMRTFPDVPSLAAAPEEQVLKCWEGLGYYSRARNLHKAAGVCVERYHGDLPDTFEELLALPGIGSYTAGAIASIVYSLPVPAVDGNVLRVMARLLAEEEDVTLGPVKKKLEGIIREILPQENPGTFNQALMELGEVICIPNGRPDCEHCPLRDMCTSFRENRQQEIPVPRRKKARRVEKLTVLLIRTEEGYALRKRPEKGLLAGMYEYPSLPGHPSLKEMREWVKRQPVKDPLLRELPPSHHIFTHVEWDMRAFEIDCISFEGDWFYAAPAQIREEYAVPGAFRIYTKLLGGES